MNITISPVAIGIILIVAGNCILSFGKSDVMKKCYIVLSSILSLVGISGIILTRLQFFSSLSRSATRRDFSSDFVSWAIAKFDFFAVISIVLTFLAIVFLLHILLVNKRNKSGFIWVNFSAFVSALMVINFLAGAWYCFGTINKLFDIAYYILELSIFEVFTLYIPLTIKRIVIFASKGGIQ